jgi:hypothetical protein
MCAASRCESVASTGTSFTGHKPAAQLDDRCSSNGHIHNTQRPCPCCLPQHDVLLCAVCRGQPSVVPSDLTDSKSYTCISNETPDGYNCSTVCNTDRRLTQGFPGAPREQCVLWGDENHAGICQAISEFSEPSYIQETLSRQSVIYIPGL